MSYILLNMYSFITDLAQMIINLCSNICSLYNKYENKLSVGVNNNNKARNNAMDETLFFIPSME